MKSKILFLIIIIAFSVLSWGQAFSQELDAATILSRVDDNYNAFSDLQFTMKMTITEANGTEKVREMRMWQKSEMRLIAFTKPATDKGTIFLATDPVNNFVFLPAFNKVRRIATHVRNQTFMGSNLSYEDMVTTRYSFDYSPSIFSQNDKTWILEVTAKAGTKAGYSKMHLTVTKDHYLITQLDYFDKGGVKIKVEKRNNFKPFVNNKYWNPANISIVTLKDNLTTKLELFDVKYDQGIPDSLFTKRSLRRPPR